MIDDEALCAFLSWLCSSQVLNDWLPVSVRGADVSLKPAA
jgi:hypothetical protein